MPVNKLGRCGRNSWILIAGMLAIEGGVWSCQRGSSPTPSIAAPAPGPAAPPPAAPAASPDKSRVVVSLTDEGFKPDHIAAEVGKPITLVVTRTTEKTCAHEILIKGEPGETKLPLNQTVEVIYTPKTSGKIPFGCAMGMMVGGEFEVK